MAITYDRGRPWHRLRGWSLFLSLVLHTGDVPTGVTRQKERPVEPIVWQYPYDPGGNPQQMRFHTVIAKEKLYGGSAGSGKSAAMLAETLRMVLQFGVTGLILRRTYPALIEIINRLQMTIPSEIGKWNDQKKTWTFKNGGRLLLGNLDHDSDVRRYAGSEYAIIAWDELTQFTEWQYRRMFHPLRVATSHPGYEPMKAAGIAPYYIAATNPGDVGHAFVKSRFVDPAPPGVVWQPTGTLDDPAPGTRVFIPAKLTDNPHMPPEYLQQLLMLPSDERRMLVDGDWDVYAGQYFPEFRREIHVVDPDDYPLPLALRRTMGIDFGVANPFAALWGAIGEDDQLIVYREMYKADVLADQQAKMILDAELKGERTPSRPIPTYLDPAAWQRQANSPAPESPTLPPRESAAWHYTRGGLAVRRADNRRIVGWQEVKRRLQVNPRTGKPGIVFFNTCTDTIRTLPELPRDKNNPEDLNSAAEDHLADALRYLCMAVYRVPPHESTTRTELRKIASLREMQLDPFRT